METKIQRGRQPDATRYRRNVLCSSLYRADIHFYHDDVWEPTTTLSGGPGLETALALTMTSMRPNAPKG